jgi:hypothetical protein
MKEGGGDWDLEPWIKDIISFQMPGTPVIFIQTIFPQSCRGGRLRIVIDDFGRLQGSAIKSTSGN